ncbi:S16C6 reductase, partial [Pseudoatta argentina]
MYILQITGAGHGIAKELAIGYASLGATLKAFLPNMIKKNHGHIVAISSVAGLFTSLYGTVYCPSKFAIKGNSTTYFTIIEKEVNYGSLSEELRVLSNGKSLIKFTTIYPFFVCTGFATTLKIRFPLMIRELLPQEVASSIIDAQRRNYENKSISSYWLPISKVIRYM